MLVLSLRRWRPLAIGIVVLGLAVSWNVAPLAASRGDRHADALAGELPRDGGDPDGARLVRQADSPQNEVLYDDELGPKAYLRWLRGLGVRYVVLPHARLDYSSRGEAEIVRSGRAGLRPVFHTAQLTIYEVARPSRIVTGPASPSLELLTESRIRVLVHRGGDYRIAVRWSPYWHASHGCLRKGKDGTLRLRTRQARTVRIVFDVDVKRAFAELAGDARECSLR